MSDHPTRPTTVTPGASPGEHPHERSPDIPPPDDAPDDAAPTRVDGGARPEAPEPAGHGDAAGGPVDVGPPTAPQALAAEPRWSAEPERPAAPSRPHRAGTPLERGTTIADRYRLEAPIATGGMATVWRAVDTVLTRPVAVKVLHAHLAADPEFVARFRREAVAAARLAHPAIVAIYDTSDDPESIIMELVDGHTLRDELDKRPLLPPREAVAIASSICQALEVAHRAGIVHRDVKPANVLLSSGGQLKVADFGIAKAARSTDDDDQLPDLTAIGRMVGTAKYLAPEQVSGGEIDARTDVYAVGAVLYEMVCGRPPFTGDNDLAVATARLHGPPDRPRAVLRTVPPRLDEIIMKALSVDADRRHSSASALWADLQSCRFDDDAPVMPPHPPADATAVGEQPSFARSERSWLVPALLVSLVAVALGLAWVLIGGTEARRDLIDLVDRVRPGGSPTEDTAEDAGPLSISAATPFDPEPDGDGSEHDDEAPLAIDGDPTTAWSTERYNSRELGGLKDGVGLVLDLQEAAQLDELVLTTPDTGWSATIHVADQPGSSLADWGEPVATVDGAGSGETTVALEGADGQHVLVWVTDLGDGGGVIFELQEVVARGG